ncbi:Phage-related baseplate assembly protein [Amantichitinum ursilacus]|uniref:Phage-related baseplate assembly protein n=2 Tax=Amantichitinum ursilacus TaxID=857265 RepID=A0A0N0GPG2_9NEIS|nr:Phage-related baseplate assembly protein [Amantichitinum ursilacus]
MAICAYRLDIPQLKLPDSLSVSEVQIKEKIGRPYELTLTVTTASAIDLLDALDKSATFSVLPVPETGMRSAIFKSPGDALKADRTWHGVVREIARVASNREEHTYLIIIAPRLARLADHVDTRLFQEVDAPALIARILRSDIGLNGSQFTIKTSKPYVIHQHYTQYGETSLDFLHRVCEAAGMAYFFTQTDDGEVVNFIDDQSHYLKPVGVHLYRPHAGLEANWTEAVLKLQVFARPVIGQQVFQDYNYRKSGGADLLGSKTIYRQDKGFVGESYRFGAHQKDPDQGKATAQLHYEIELARQIVASGEGNVLAFAPGQIFRTDQVDAQASFGWVITEVTHTASRSKAWFNAFKAIPADRIIRLPQTTPKPTISGTIPARITSPSHYTAGFLSEQGLYRVTFLYDRDAKAGHWPPAGSSRLMRLARPYAGGTYGFHFPLISGTEVAVAFSHGDIDRPYIAHALHDQTRPDLVTSANYSRNVIRTPSNNKIRLEDRDGQQHIKVSTEYGKSQLNLGHLVNAGREKRGEGFELRSDAFGAVRANGIWISADQQPLANGHVLEMKSATDLLKQAVTQSTELGKIAQTHLNPPTDTASLQQLADAANQLSGPVILMSAPAGIAQVTPASLGISTGHAFHVQSGGAIRLGGGGKTDFTSVQSMSLLAQTQGLRMVSGKGPLQIESHGDKLDATALQDVTIQSTQGHVQITARNGITLATGGAYIKLTPDGQILVHGPSLLSLKGNHTMDGPTSQDYPLPDLPKSVCVECMRAAAARAVGIVPSGGAA